MVTVNVNVSEVPANAETVSNLSRLQIVVAEAQAAEPLPVTTQKATMPKEPLPPLPSQTQD